VACAERPAQVAWNRTIDDPDRVANIAGARFTPMSLVKWGFVALLLLPAAEVTAFIVVAVLIGWLWAACLFLATTVVGLAILKRSGRADIERFRREFARDGIYAIHLESPGLGPIIGGILLVIPGFITDVLGLMLLVPAIRRWLRGSFGRALERARKARDPEVIDLAPDEWHHLSDKAIKHGTKRKRIR
jgi:UPF0716 protein FxsA